VSTHQYVIFGLEYHRFGIGIAKIKEVLSYRQITPLPNLQGFIKGVINLRGTIVPVFDLREKFHLPEVNYTPFHVIIVIEIAGRVMGVLTDEITDVLEIDPAEVQDTANLPPGMQAQYLQGIIHQNQELIILLNMDRLLSHDELELLDAT
jgi:purine-binding chemotaxis protein CheW